MKILIIAAVVALASVGACSQQASTTSTNPAPSSPVAAAPAAPDDAESTFQDLAERVPTAELSTIYTAANDPNHLLGRPNGYTSKIAFTDNRIKLPDGFRSDAIEAGGSLEVYPDAEGAMARMMYIQEIVKARPCSASTRMFPARPYFECRGC